ncbi:MAG: HAMP domain-containing histidine kinase [Thiotrichaceae bacterium]|nr:HAMP domain-containing histidine kinase [Thiotrichaceae bacterium]
MTPRISLRYRVALTFFLLGWLVSMVMGGMLYGLTISLEEKLIEETLSTELEDYMIRYEKDPTILPPSSTHIQGYVYTKNKPDTLPEDFRQLPTGLSHILIEGAGYYVELRENNKARFLVLYSDELIKQREEQYVGYLISGITLITFLSSVLGFWLANRVISPVIRLAQQVTKIENDFIPLKLEEGYRKDEVGKLAQAFEVSHQRLVEFIERERYFTGDVSHELRTPLTIIEGATEILLSDDMKDSHRKGVLRIARASSQIIRLTSALLTLAREKPQKNEAHHCSVKTVLERVVDDHRYLLTRKAVEVNLSVHTDFVTNVDTELLYVVLANLIRNAFGSTKKGNVHIQLFENRIVIEDTGTGMSDDERLKIFDRYYSTNKSTGGQGIGLSLVKRICQYYDWKVSVSSREHEGTVVELLLNNSI